MTSSTIQQNFDQALRHHQAGRLREAEQLYRQILAQEPEHSGALYYLGAIARKTGRNDVALDLIRRAIAIKPNFIEAHFNLGNTLRDMGRLDEAIDSYRQAINLKPDYADAYSNLGYALIDSEQRDEAVAAYRQAIQIKPDDTRAHWNLAVLLLSMGQFAEGWDEFEWRLKDKSMGLRRDFASPQWNGEDLAGKTLLLHTEGGYGDAFQFIRYAPLLRGRAKKIILECAPTLVKLFSDLPGVDEIITRGQALPAFDYQIPLQSLPRLFKTNLTNIPNAVPYLKVTPEDRARWKERVQNDGQLNVGLVWAGSSRPNMSDDLRTRGLDIFARLGQIPGVRFFSLQKGPESSLPRLPGLELTDLTHDLNDFADTAALIENLDLVISADTSVAHLAGALAKPVWVLIPFTSDFRWLLNRTDSPWYPTMRLFRQKRHDDWETVIAEVEAALKEIRGLT